MTDAKDANQRNGAPAKGGGAAAGLLGIILPAVFAAGAAFGGVRLAGAHREAAAPASSAAEAEAMKPPGPTLALDPFLLSIADANKKVHPMKVTIAIEFDPKEKDESLKGLTPRIRDAVLGFLRSISYDEAIDPNGGDKIRTDLLDRLRGSGVPTAERVLITDLVIQ